MLCLTSRDWCRHCVAGRGAERRHQRHPAHADEHPLVCTDCGSLSGDATPILVAKDRRIGTISTLLVERNGAADPRAVEKLAEWVDARGPPQVIKRSDGDPAVMLRVAAARKTVARTTLETSTPGDHAGHGHEGKAVGLVGGVVSTLKNEMKYICKMAMPTESKTNASIIYHATTLTNLDTFASDKKAPCERWRGRSLHMGRCVFREKSTVQGGSAAEPNKS